MWRPSCSVETLRARSILLGRLRNFFQQRALLEVQTAVLSRNTVTDPGIQSFAVSQAQANWYLQTSPEHQMKRLLAAGAPGIYQICPAFRQEEMGRFHNCEFTLLEWYRPGFSLPELMSEVADLVKEVLPETRFRSIRYGQLLQDYFGVNPHLAKRQQLLAALVEFEPSGREGETVSTGGDSRTPDTGLEACSSRELIDLLFDRACTELTGGWFITDYPSDQAALAKTTESHQGYATAQRFELVIDGLEIANGYLELLEADIARTRMQQDLAIRRRQGAVEPPMDEHLLSAMQTGLPECSGVALGVDRLLMLQLGVKDISEVLPFPQDRT